jgi:hypothetical protein
VAPLPNEAAVGRVSPDAGRPAAAGQKATDIQQRRARGASSGDFMPTMPSDLQPDQRPDTTFAAAFGKADAAIFERLLQLGIKAWGLYPKIPELRRGHIINGLRGEMAWALATLDPERVAIQETPEWMHRCVAAVAEMSGPPDNERFAQEMVETLTERAHGRVQALIRGLPYEGRYTGSNRWRSAACSVRRRSRRTIAAWDR